MLIQNKLNNRVALKYNHILIDRLEISISGNGFMHTRPLAMYEVQDYLNSGKFDNFVNVQLASESGSFGPDHKASPLMIKKLTRLLKNTNYDIVAVNGQNFTIEGLN